MKKYFFKFLYFYSILGSTTKPTPGPSCHSHSTPVDPSWPSRMTSVYIEAAPGVYPRPGLARVITQCGVHSNGAGPVRQRQTCSWKWNTYNYSSGRKCEFQKLKIILQTRLKGGWTSFPCQELSCKVCPLPTRPSLMFATSSLPPLLSG